MMGQIIVSINSSKVSVKEDLHFASACIEQEHEYALAKCKSSFKETLEEPLSKPTLRILKWNANGHSTRAQELCDRLAAESIGVCLIQETNPRLSRVDCLPPTLLALV